MKSISILAASALVLLTASRLHAQTPERTLHVQSLILDDKNGHHVTITPAIDHPGITGNYTVQLPDDPDTLLTRFELRQNPLAAMGGGTGIGHFNIGDILYASTDSTLAVLTTSGAISGRMLALQSDGNGHLIPMWISAGGVGTVSGTTGEVTASPTTGDVVVGLADVSTITPGSYTMPDLTVDAKGRITAISSSTAAGGGIYCGETSSKLSNSSGTNYFFPMGPSIGNGNTNQLGVTKTLCPRTGTLINFYVALDIAPGFDGPIANTRRFRIVDETSGEYLEALITGSETAGNSGSTAHFHTTAGDIIHVEQTGSGSGLGTPIATWAFEVQ